MIPNSRLSGDKR